MNGEVASWLLHHLDRDDDLAVGAATAETREWLQRLGLPPRLERLLRQSWPQKNSGKQNVSLWNLPTIQGLYYLENLLAHGLFPIGDRKNGDPFVIDFSLDSCPVGFVSHEEWDPESGDDPRQYFTHSARSLETFLYRVSEGRFVPYDYFAAGAFNQFLEDEYRYDPFPPYSPRDLCGHSGLEKEGGALREGPGPGLDAVQPKKETTLNLDLVRANRKSGKEHFSDHERSLTFDLLSFWRWSGSDIFSNATRGLLAEYLVARALGVGVDDVRDEWAPCDITMPSGLKVEVKPAAYLQAWFQKRLSTISFIVAKTRKWDSATNVLHDEPTRKADVYVFALLAHKDKATVDPMKLEQWQFYVLPTSVLDARTRSQHSITLKSLEELCPPLAYRDLRDAVEKAASRVAGS